MKGSPFIASVHVRALVLAGLGVAGIACVETHTWASEDADNDGLVSPRFEEGLGSQIAEPKLPGVGWVGLKPRLRNSPGGSTLDLPLHIETGIATDLGVELVLPGHVVAPHGETTRAGLGDLHVTVKYDLMGVAYPDYALALGVEAGFPTGKEAEGFGENKYTLGPVAILSARFGALETHAAVELGVALATRSVEGVETSSNAELGANLAAHYRVTEGLGIIGEFASDVDPSDGREAASLIAGIWFEPVESIEIGLGIEVPVDPWPGRDPGVVAALWRHF